MIITESMENNLVRNYSDNHMKIRQVETGAIYDEAVDVVPCRYTYEETDIPLEEYENPYSEEVARILMGDMP